MKNQFVKQDSLTRDFPHNRFRISHDSKRGALLIMTGIVFHGAVFGLVIHTFGRPNRGSSTGNKRYDKHDREAVRDGNGEIKPFSDTHRFHIDSFGSVTLIVKPKANQIRRSIFGVFESRAGKRNKCC